MKVSGKLTRVGKWWAAEIAALGVFTQGKTREEVLEMVADAIETLVNQEGFRAKVHKSVEDDCFEISTNDYDKLIELIVSSLREI
jgi:predicted RNase H-like HicB family nuclease